MIFVVDIDPGSPRANSVIDIIDSIPVFPGADTFPFIDVVVNSNNGQIYALLVDGWQTQWRTLTTIDGASDTATSTVMAGLSAATNGLLLNPSSSDIYVTNTGLPDGPGVLMRFRHAVAPRLATPADPQREVVVVAAQASVTFAAVTAAGETVVTPIDPAEQSLTLPGQFSIANALAYDVSTTANVRPPIQLCLIFFSGLRSRI